MASSREIWITHACMYTHTDTDTQRYTALWTLSRITQMSRYQKGKTNRDFTEARDSEWQWQQLGHMQICTSPHSVFLQAGCLSCRPTNSIKAL